MPDFLAGLSSILPRPLAKFYGEPVRLRRVFTGLYPLRVPAEDAVDSQERISCSEGFDRESPDESRASNFDATGPAVNHPLPAFTGPGAYPEAGGSQAAAPRRIPDLLMNPSRLPYPRRNPLLSRYAAYPILGALLFFGAPQAARSQFIEFGASAGTFGYSGDLVRKYSFKHLNPALSIHYTLNLSEYLGIKWSLAASSLSGDDGDPYDAFAAKRDTLFDHSVTEFAMNIEYYFLDFKTKYTVYRWSPYAFVGFSVLRFNEPPPDSAPYGRMHVGIPVGIGFKHLLGKQFAIAAEAGLRKTFSDYIDTISDEDVTTKNYKYANKADKDLYHVFGIQLSYILFQIPCPFPYIPNEWMSR